MANVLGELFGDIASAIREKTGDAEKMKPAQFPEKISEIETGADVSGVTATAEDVLAGKIIVDADGNEVDGSIPVVETSEVELTVQTPSGAIPVGYYANGLALSVAAKSAAVTPTKETQNLADSFYDSITVDPIPDKYQDVSGVTATAEDVAEGKVIVDAQGNEVVGTLVASSGSNVIRRRMSYNNPSKGDVTFTHNVGAIPDMVIAWSDNANNTSATVENANYVLFGFKNNFTAGGHYQYKFYTDSSKYLLGNYSYASITTTTSKTMIYGTTENQITFANMPKGVVYADLLWGLQ